MENKIHQGHNVKRFREMKGIKQEALAYQLGENWNQKKVSLLEQKEVIDAEIINNVASALDIPEEAIRSFSDELGSQILTRNFAPPGIRQYHNSVEIILRLHEEKILLYERMLQEKEEMIVWVKETVAL